MSEHNPLIQANNRIYDLEQENKQLRQILYDTISKTDLKIMEGKGFYSITLTIDGKMYGKIQEIIRELEHDV